MMLVIIWLSATLTGIIYSFLISYFNNRQEWRDELIVLKVFSLVTMPFYALNCFLFALIIYKLQISRALAADPGQL